MTYCCSVFSDADDKFGIDRVKSVFIDYSIALWTVGGFFYWSVEFRCKVGNQVEA